jgi:hypothetical protein
MFSSKTEKFSAKILSKHCFLQIQSDGTRMDVQEVENYRQLSDKKAQCLLCDKIMNRWGMKNHLKSHKTCSKCGKKFGGTKGSWLHTRHEGKCLKKIVKKKNCDFCPRIFIFNCHRVNHQKTCRFRPK